MPEMSVLCFRNQQADIQYSLQDSGFTGIHGNGASENLKDCVWKNGAKGHFNLEALWAYCPSYRDGQHLPATSDLEPTSIVMYNPPKYLYIISSLHMNLQVFELSKMWTCVFMSNQVGFHMSNIHCHMHASLQVVVFFLCTVCSTV